MQKFEDYFGHEYDIVAQTAEILAEAAESLKNGEITRSEFDELSKDMIEFIDIDELSTNVDIKLAIRETIEILKMIAEHIPFT